MFQAKEFCGSFEQSPGTTHVVSVWHIPGGTEYHSATVTNVFFDNVVNAKLFTKRWENPPEMAMMNTIEEHEAILERIAALKAKRDAEHCHHVR